MRRIFDTLWQLREVVAVTMLCWLIIIFIHIRSDTERENITALASQAAYKQGYIQVQFHTVQNARGSYNACGTVDGHPAYFGIGRQLLVIGKDKLAKRRYASYCKNAVKS